VLARTSLSLDSLRIVRDTPSPLATSRNHSGPTAARPLLQVDRGGHPRAASATLRRSCP
jgi:hypothetical protein